MKNLNNQDWNIIKGQFTEYMKQKHFSSSHIYAVLNATNQFYDFIISHYDKFDIKQITSDMLDKFHNSLIERKLFSSSIHSYLKRLKTFFRFLIKSKYILFNPMDKIDIPKVEMRLPKEIPTIKQMEKVLNLPDINSLVGLRDKAILELFYSTAIRRDELRKLNIYDIDLEQGYLRVQGKGRKERVVPVGKTACYWVKKYLNQSRVKLAEGKYTQAMFVNWLGDRLGIMSVGKIVVRYMKKAGYKFNTHAIRHACASHLMQNGAKLKYIQMLLGHSRLSTTQIYTHIVKKDLIKVYNATHPSAKRKEIVRFEGGDRFLRLKSKKH